MWLHIEIFKNEPHGRKKICASRCVVHIKVTYSSCNQLLVNSHKDQTCRPQPGERPLCCRLERSAQAGGSMPWSPTHTNTQRYRSIRTSVCFVVKLPCNSCSNYFCMRNTLSENIEYKQTAALFSEQLQK